MQVLHNCWAHVLFNPAYMSHSMSFSLTQVAVAVAIPEVECDGSGIKIRKIIASCPETMDFCLPATKPPAFHYLAGSHLQVSLPHAHLSVS